MPLWWNADTLALEPSAERRTSSSLVRGTIWSIRLGVRTQSLYLCKDGSTPSWTTMNKQLLKRIEEIFIEKLQAKTGWGKNEIIIIYKESVNEAILETLD